MKKLSSTQFEAYVNMYEKYYYKTARASIIIDSKKYYCTVYYLQKNIEKNSLFYDLIYQYPNTAIGYSQSQYAPEIKHSVIFLYDQKIEKYRKEKQNEK